MALTAVGAEAVTVTSVPQTELAGALLEQERTVRTVGLLPVPEAMVSDR